MNVSTLTRDLLKDAAYFSEALKGSSGKDSVSEARYCRAVIFSAWSALEGWVNYVCSDFTKLSEAKLSQYERAFLSEKRIEISDNGILQITENDAYQKTQAKLFFLLRRFGNYSIAKESSLWREFKEAQRIRHSLVHPKIGSPDVSMDAKTAELFLGVTREVISLMSHKIYRRSLRLPV